MGDLFSAMCRALFVGVVAVVALAVAIVALATMALISRYGFVATATLFAPAILGFLIKDLLEESAHKARLKAQYALWQVEADALWIRSETVRQRLVVAQAAEATAKSTWLRILNFPVVVPGLLVGLVCAMALASS